MKKENKGDVVTPEVVTPKAEKPKKETKAVAVAEPKAELVPQNQSIENLIGRAIENNTPVETMEKLLSMRRELKAEYAKEQFDKDMALFQGECPVIKKTKAGGQTNSGQVAYYYAPLDSIVSQVKEIIQKHGFSYTIKTETKESGVKVTCVTKHKAGHSESTDVEVPLGTKTGVMSASQVVASALTFAKRYAFCNAFGILTGDDDDDSNLTKTAEKKDTAFDKLMGAVDKSTLEQLHDYKKKMEKSDKYTADEKSKFTIAVENRIAKLTKEK